MKKNLRILGALPVILLGAFGAANASTNPARGYVRVKRFLISIASPRISFYSFAFTICDRAPCSRRQ